jgi:hypothetical protein
LRGQGRMIPSSLSKISLLGAVLLTVLSGCVVKDTRPLPKMQAVQASAQIPETELLDLAIRHFETGIPEKWVDDEEALEKRRIYPDVRSAEARLLPMRLRATLESTGQWGAVRVVPESVQFVDVLVSGRILESSGAELELMLTAVDATGRVWIRDKKYSGDADLGSYKTDAALRARDPFQNVYVQIANDLLAARNTLTAAERRDLRRVAELRFAADLDPASFSGYLRQDSSGRVQIQRLPADDDPALARINKIRDRDAAVIDTLDGYAQEFSDKLFDSYGGFRRTSREAIEREDKARAQAMTRTALGAAAVLASIFASGNCAPGDYNCQRIDSAVRTAGAVGGVAAVMSGIKKFADANMAANEIKELAASFSNEAAAQTVEIEGRTLKLTGTAEEQYREWRRLLAAIYREENTPLPTPGL